ncbi:unnamed protein product [Rotaria magnacalcarata]|uniref:Uncharacterized protein n=1 Tax=Rotaria magnacalcarata TaxID=392030 RepID=A0A816U9P9_9BILA|nr:unnamed protein product [Rotaria magnacalcarata]CAF4265008.1 unnamed protein product [Rotaria magnacalcarata]
MQKRKEAALARRSQQQINNAQPQPQPENPTPSSSHIKVKVLTIKLNGIVQVKRSYEHISNENVTGENVLSITNEKNIKRKTSNNQNVHSKETSVENELDSECVINNINDIGLRHLDQLQTFETESHLNQILVTAEIHANPDYNPILNTSNEIHNENTLTTGTDISVAISLQQLDQLQTFETESHLNQILVTAEIHANPDYDPTLNTSNEIHNENTSNENTANDIHNENTLTTGNDISVAIDPSAAINDLNTINTTGSLESINLTNNDNDGSISNNQPPAPDRFNADLDLNDFIIGSRDIACTKTFFINESIVAVNKKYSSIDIKYTINIKNVWHMHKNTIDDNILEIFEDFLKHINLSINEYFLRVGHTGFIKVKIGNHECTFDASSPYVRFSEDIVFSLIDQFSDQIQSGSCVSFNQIYCDVSIIFEGYGHGTNDVMGVNIGSLLNKKSFIASHLNTDTNKRDCLFRAISYVVIRTEKMKNAPKGATGARIIANEIDAKARVLSIKCQLPLEIAATPVHLEKIALKLDIRIACYMIEENTGLIKTFYTNADISSKTKNTVLLCLYKNCYYPLLYPKSLILAKNCRANLCWGCLRYVTNLLLHSMECLGKCKYCLSTSCDAPPDNEQNNEIDRQNDDEIDIVLNMPQPAISCDNCKRLFKTTDCLNKHKPICNQYKLCECGEYILYRQKHKCFHTQCQSCNKMVATLQIG